MAISAQAGIPTFFDVGQEMQQKQAQTTQMQQQTELNKILISQKNLDLDQSKQEAELQREAANIKMTGDQEKDLSNLASFYLKRGRPDLAAKMEDQLSKVSSRKEQAEKRAQEAQKIKLDNVGRAAQGYLDTLGKIQGDDSLNDAQKLAYTQYAWQSALKDSGLSEEEIGQYRYVLDPKQQAQIAERIKSAGQTVKDQEKHQIDKQNAGTKALAEEHKDEDNKRKDVTKNRDITVKREMSTDKNASAERIAETRAESAKAIATINKAARIEAADRVHNAKTKDQGDKVRESYIKGLSNPKNIKQYESEMSAAHPEISTVQRSTMAQDLARVESDILRANPDLHFEDAHQEALKQIEQGISTDKGILGFHKKATYKTPHTSAVNVDDLAEQARKNIPQNPSVKPRQQAQQSSTEQLKVEGSGWKYEPDKYEYKEIDGVMHRRLK